MKNSNGNPVISYHDFDNFDLELAVCTDPVCSNPTLTTVADSGLVGWYTSLALNSSNIPFISYYDLSGFDLKLSN